MKTKNQALHWPQGSSPMTVIISHLNWLMLCYERVSSNLSNRWFIMLCKWAAPFITVHTMV
jgi:hypothetical protein